ncbi:MFS transporter, partial [Micromonospora zhanjiangensis]
MSRHRLIHPAWLVAAVTFVALVGAAGFRATPSVLLHPLHAEFGWPLATISAAVSVNLILYGLTAPFAAALMDRFGVRRVVAGALVLVSAGSGLTVFMTASWQLVLCWGVLVGLGTGSMALAFVATVTGRWFVRHRGLVTGVLTAGGAAGQLVFLPLLAVVVRDHGWRTAALIVAAAALVVLFVVLALALGGPVAGAVPLLAASAAVTGTLLGLRLVAAVTPVGEFTANVVTLLGIGLTVDYALLMIARFREERAAEPGAGTAELLARTTATAGR